jgi:hypothetical protein
MFVNQACQALSGLSELEAASKPGTATSSVDTLCGGQCGAPSCLNGRCVDDDVAQRWVCAAEPPAREDDVVRYEFDVVEYLSREPPNDIAVKACLNKDVGCTEPVATFVDRDGTGHVQLTLKRGFLGYFDVDSDILPTRLYITKPILESSIDRDVPVVSVTSIENTVAAAGLEYDPTKGIAIVDALECSKKPAGGVHFQLSDADADHFYLVDQVPSRDATVTSYDKFTNTADAGFVNIAPGFVTFHADWGVDGPELQAFNAQIRAGSLTFIDIVP